MENWGWGGWLGGGGGYFAIKYFDMKDQGKCVFHKVEVETSLIPSWRMHVGYISPSKQLIFNKNKKQKYQNNSTDRRAILFPKVYSLSGSNWD